MHKPLRCWTYTALGLSVVAAPGASARSFNAAIVPVEHPVLGAGPRPLAPDKRALVTSNRRTIVPMTVALVPDPIDETSRSFDLRLTRDYQSNPFASLKASVSARGTGMRDAYAHGSSGLRASLGSSYHMQYRAAKSGPGALAGSAALMRLPVGAVNLRDGYEGYAPVAMLGYDQRIGDRMKIGVEGGMMVGRSTAMYADETVPGLATQRHDERNPVADVVMTYAF